MTGFKNNWTPWDTFQVRIRAAISRAENEHDTLYGLFHDLMLCEMYLRMDNTPRKTLEDFDSPVAREIAKALENHANEELVRYDATYAADIILQVVNATIESATEDEA